MANSPRGAEQLDDLANCGILGNQEFRRGISLVSVGEMIVRKNAQLKQHGAILGPEINHIL